MATQTHHVVSLSAQEFIRLFAKATQTNGYMRTAQPSAFIGTEAEKTAQTPVNFCSSAALTKPHHSLSVCIYCCVHLGDLSVSIILISQI